MVFADAINLIIRKLGPRVVFCFIGVSKNGEPVIHIEFAHNKYAIEFFGRFTVSVKRFKTKRTAITDNYSRWIEGILNGMVRNEKGEMVRT